MHVGRRLLLLPHAADDVAVWSLRHIGEPSVADVLWIADRAPLPFLATASRKAGTRLGGESRLVVVDTHQGFHPDAFAAAVGTLRDGGDCVLITPPLNEWATYPDPDKKRFAAYPQTIDDMRGLFVQRMLAFFADHPAVAVVDDLAAGAPRLAPHMQVASVELNAEQRDLSARVQRVARGHARRPLVVTADRGRGKSTALGIAAAQLLLEGYPRVTVVAPHKHAVQTLFRHAAQLAGVEQHQVEDLPIGNGVLAFRQPAEWMSGKDDIDGLVIIDEAAAIPVVVLNDVVHRANRLVFASTAHGYEGSGRGFELRFRDLLNRHFTQVHDVRLQHPVRWRDDDALESVLNDLLLLNADTEAMPESGSIEVERIEAEMLLADEHLLRATFGLLVNAHYQTRPSDLRQLLDNPAVHIWLARRDAVVVGVVMAVEEGAIDEAMCEQIMRAQRRPRGHLLPQSLAVHVGLEAFLRLRLLRIQRIAVHPQARRQGVGRQLLDAAKDWAGVKCFDALGCSYGVEADLLAFWQSAGFSAARVGSRIDPAVASPSVFMLRALSEAGMKHTAFAHERFQRDLPWALDGSLQSLDPYVAIALLQSRDCSDLAFDAHDLAELGRIAQGARETSLAEALVWRSIVRLCAQAAACDDLALGVAVILQHWPMPLLQQRFSVTGARELEQRLRRVAADALAMPHSVVDGGSKAP